MMRHVLLTLLLPLLFAVGCSKKEEAPAKPSGPPPLTDTEIDRGVTACDNFAKRVCACAENKEDLKNECDLAKARPEALELAIKVSKQEATNASPPKDKWAAFQNARVIMKSCLEDDMNFKCDAPAPPE